MNVAFLIVTVLFMLVSLALVLIILVQRPSGGGLAGAFGGAGGSGSDTVFGGRVGDALTWATVAFFVLYLGFAIALNLLDEVGPTGPPPPAGTSLQAPAGGTTTVPVILGDTPVEIIGEDASGEQIEISLPTEDTPDNSADDEVDTTTEDPGTTDPPGGDN